MALFGITRQKKHSCAQGRGSSLILRDPSLCSGSGLAAIPLVPIPSFYPILPLSTARVSLAHG